MKARSSPEERSWESVEITVPAECVESVESALNALDCLGSYHDLFGGAPGGEVTVTGYFERMPSREELLGELGRALGINGFQRSVISDIKTAAVSDEDWLAEWKKSWKPTITGCFVVSPPWDETRFPDKIVIEIEPNMAFGTGTHETTRLCLEEIERLFTPGMSFLDVGTGTGVLAIAAFKLAKLQNGEDASPRVGACDIDEESVRIAAENFASNDVSGVDLYAGTLRPGSPRYDLVCANLTADVIVPLIPALLDKSKRFVLLSGILVEQRERVEAGISVLGFGAEFRSEGEWCSLTVDKGV